VPETQLIDPASIKYSVIIPAYNAEKTLSLCLEKLSNQSLDRNIYEIILVDDGSTDNTAGIAGKFDVRYIFQANNGPASARNKGAEEAIGNIILFTDSDCEPDSMWIEEMVKPFEDANIAASKGCYRTRQKELAARFAQAEFEDRFDLLKQSITIDMVDTYSAAFRRDVFMKMKGFDESFPVANNEDTELSYRLDAEGYKLVFTPKAFVYHIHHDSFYKYLKLKFWRGYWRIFVYRKYPQKAVKDSYTPAVIKIQTILMALSLVVVPLSWIVTGFLYLALLLWGIIIISSLPFSFKTFSKDSTVGFISPGVILLRSLVFALGSLFGLAR
jgi:glycosyltransferase involved in cell wall biosynthesis